MTFRLFQCDITVSIPFAALVAAMLFFDRTGLFVISLCVILIHETGHLAACRLLRQSPERIVLRPGAVQIFTPPSALPVWWDVGIALAGPVANLAVGAVSMILWFHKIGTEWLPVFAVGNLVVALFNLCPVRGLDGGRVLELWLYSRFGSSGERAMRWISLVWIVILLGVGCWTLYVSGGNSSLLIAASYLALFWLLGIRS